MSEDTEKETIRGGFDFSLLDENYDNLTDQVIDYIYQYICDAEPLDHRYDPMEYLNNLGYFKADTFYVLNPYKYLGLTKYNWTNQFYRGMQFLILGPEVSLETLKVDTFNNLKVDTYQDDKVVKTKDFDETVIEHIPLVIFQMHKGPFVTNEGEVVLPERLFKPCKNDFCVFRGIFKATLIEDSGDYKIEKIWDRYYFRAPVK